MAADPLGAWGGDARKGSEATEAKALLAGKHQFGARQGGPFREAGYVDARGMVCTKHKKGEWTGFHAEMILVSGMLAGAGKDPRQMTIEEAATFFKTHGCKILVNAPCCKHCANMLDTLEIQYDERSENAGLTGWWNPFTDEAIPNADAEFQKELPMYRTRG